MAFCLNLQGAKSENPLEGGGSLGSVGVPVEQPVFSTDHKGSDGILRHVVVYGNAAVLQIAVSVLASTPSKPKAATGHGRMSP